jgi:hypothetical protein
MESVLFNCTPPRKIIPLLIEWWLILRKDNNNFRYAEITAIESVNVEDPNDFFWRHSKVFVDNKEPAQNMIISANSKTGIIMYYPEDANGDPFIDSITQRAIRKTMYCHNILIYHCTGILEKVFLSVTERYNAKTKRNEN